MAGTSSGVQCERFRYHEWTATCETDKDWLSFWLWKSLVHWLNVSLLSKCFELVFWCWAVKCCLTCLNWCFGVELSNVAWHVWIGVLMLSCQMLPDMFEFVFWCWAVKCCLTCLNYSIAWVEIYPCSRVNRHGVWLCWFVKSHEWRVSMGKKITSVYNWMSQPFFISIRWY